MIMFLSNMGGIQSHATSLVGQTRLTLHPCNDLYIWLGIIVQIRHSIEEIFLY